MTTEEWLLEFSFLSKVAKHFFKRDIFAEQNATVDLQ